MTARDRRDMRSEGATFREWKGKMIGLEEVIKMHILNLAMASNFQVFIYAQAIGSSQWSCCDCWQAGAAPKHAAGIASNPESLMANGIGVWVIPCAMDGR